MAVELVSLDVSNDTEQNRTTQASWDREGDLTREHVLMTLQ